MNHKKEPPQYWIPVAVIIVFVAIFFWSLHSDQMKRLKANHLDEQIAASIWQATNDLNYAIRNSAAAQENALNIASNSLVEQIAEHQWAAPVTPAMYATNYSSTNLNICCGVITNNLYSTNGWIVYGICSTTNFVIQPQWGDAIAIWSRKYGPGMMIEFKDHEQWLAGDGNLDCDKRWLRLVWSATNGFVK